jgi:hypothetical protein
VVIKRLGEILLLSCSCGFSSPRVMTETRGEFGSPEEGNRSPSEAVTRRLLKIVTEDISVYNSEVQS